jgi:penicillin-binding protein 1A
VWLGNDDFTPMARVTGGSFPAQIWQTYMTAAHDTDNIPNIPGVEPHPLQVAEQARIAAVMSQNATADLPIPPPAESVKDMSAATRQILETLSGLLKEARPLKPSNKAQPDRAQAPATAQPSLASAGNADGTPRPDPTPVATEAESTVSVDPSPGAALPQ